jgi:hypothetical protein
MVMVSGSLTLLPADCAELLELDCEHPTKDAQSTVPVNKAVNFLFLNIMPLLIL